MAAIKRLGPGRFRARVRRKGHPALSATFPTRELAERWARQAELAIAEGRLGGLVRAERMTLGDALARYAAEVTPGKRSHKQELTRIAWLRAQPLAALPFGKVRGADLAEYRDARLAGVSVEALREARRRGEDPAAHPDAKPVKANTVRLELAALSHLYTIARTEWGMEGLQSPIRAVRKPPTGNGRDRRLARAVGAQEGEEARLLRAAEPALRTAIVLALETAMRRGELAGLRWDYVDLARRVVRLPLTKSGDRREVPLTPSAAAELQRLKDGPRRIDGYVFGPPAVAAEGITQAFRRACRRARITGLTFHDLRHEATSRLFERGLGIAEVAAITGHKTLAMLKRYTHLRTEDLVAKLEDPPADPVAVRARPRVGAVVLQRFRRRSRGVDTGAAAA